MTEKKMTESEIMKALECISGKIFYCSDCAYRCGSVAACHKKSAKDALDLINRKNAEIELLENESKRQATKAIKDVFQAIDFMCIDTFGNFNHKAFINLKKEMGVE